LSLNTIEKLIVFYYRGDKPLNWLKDKAGRAFNLIRDVDLQDYDQRAFNILKGIATGEGDSFKQFEDDPLMRFWKFHFVEKQYFQERSERLRKKALQKAEQAEIDAIFSAKPI
jgi:hypothetical protein